MKRDFRPSDDFLGSLLRRGDPACDGSAPSAVEIASMRARVLAEAEHRSARAWLPAPALAAAAVVLVTAFLGWNTARLGRDAERAMTSPVNGTTVRAGSDRGSDSQERPRIRQVEFLTPGGTRVVWLLNPDFEV
jgi:hypothetical protein